MYQFHKIHWWQKSIQLVQEISCGPKTSTQVKDRFDFKSKWFYWKIGQKTDTGRCVTRISTVIITNYSNQSKDYSNKKLYSDFCRNKINTNKYKNKRSQRFGTSL